MTREQLHLVIVGHVDHGKSTVIGRLLADTGSLPDGKLEQVKAHCEKTARPFEYAFLLDALKEEQSQGITIDCARCFFKTAQRDYILTDAPGHVAFLKNMVTGAARAEAALVVIDAQEGIQENTRRHGTFLSLLGVKQLAVIINKMDLVAYDDAVFERLKAEYGAFLASLNLPPPVFVPVSARDGDNIVRRRAGYNGPTALECIDAFEKPAADTNAPLRFPIQDVYKFTALGDDRRIFAGTIASGTLRAGEDVLFLPSRQTARIHRIESFNRPAGAAASAGEAVGVTLESEPYVKAGEILCRPGEAAPEVTRRFRAHLFWMGKAPLIPGKKVKLKIGTARVPAQLVQVHHVIDATNLTGIRNKKQVDYHDVAECVLETSKPVALDPVSRADETGRFVLVDNYEIAGGGVVLSAVSDGPSALSAHIQERESHWERGAVSAGDRAQAYGHRPKFVVLSGGDAGVLSRLGKALEAALFNDGRKTYFFSPSNIDRGLDADVLDPFEKREERTRRLGELARIMTDAGQIFITALPDGDAEDMAILAALNAPNEILTVHVGGPAAPPAALPVAPSAVLPAAPQADTLGVDGLDIPTAVVRICEHLQKKAVIPDYYI